MMARIVGAVARHESEHKSDRMKAKAAQRAEGGHAHPGGNRPFGFKTKPRTDEDGQPLLTKRGNPSLRVTDEHDPAEAKLIREAAKRLLAAESLRSVAVDWNRRGIRTVRGGAWSPTALRDLMMSARIAGLREYKGVMYPATWKPIIDEDTHTALRALLGDPARRTSRSARRYLLAGLLVCGRCGTKMVSHPRGYGRTYTCRKEPGNKNSCGRVRIVADPLEALVTDAAMKAAAKIAGLATRTGMLPADVTSDDPEAIKAQMAVLAATWADGAITHAEWEAARKVLSQRMADADQADADELRAQAAARQLVDLEQRWPGLTLVQQQAALKTLFDRVVIGSANGAHHFDPNRVTIEEKPRRVRRAA
jgi:hypothetical protein